MCPAKVPTIGYGTTIYPNGQKVQLTDKVITSQEAEAYLQNDLRQFEKDVEMLVQPALTQNQFDALVSFAYNLGIGNLSKSTLLKKVNAMPYDTTIRAEFLKWNKAGGKVLNGLTRRRTAEADLYFKQ
jgi:lysozyme